MGRKHVFKRNRFFETVKKANDHGRVFAYYNEGDEIRILSKDDDGTLLCKRISDGKRQWVQNDEICEVTDEEKTVITSRVAFFDKEETIENCTVQILTNTKTGEVSIGWWRNE